MFKVLALFLAIIALPLYGQTTVNVVLNESGTKYKSAKIGVGAYGSNVYNDFTMQNLIQSISNSFGGVQFRQVEYVATGSTTGFTSNNLFDGITANFAAGYQFVVACHLTGTTCSGGAEGLTGTIASNTAATPGSVAPSFTFTSALSTAVTSNDFIYIYSTSTVPTSNAFIGWALNGSGTYSIDTTTGDLPPAVYGLPQPASCMKVTNTAGQYSYFETYIDATAGQLNYAFSGYYTQGIQANLLSGSLTIQMQVQRSGEAALINSTATNITSGWNTYTAVNSTAATETSATTPGAVAVVYTVSGTGSACFIGAYLNENAHTNASPFRDAIIANRQLMNIGTMRYNFLQGAGGGTAGCTLSNLLQPQKYRVACTASQYSSSPYTSNPSVGIGLHEFLQGAQAAGATSIEYAIPVTWSTTDLQNFIDYMDGGSGTTYGAIRIALGQTTPWNQVFSTIVYDFGNEAWNSSTPGVYYYPGAGDGYSHYLPLAISFCSALKAEPGYNTSVEKCAMNVQQAYGATNASTITAVDTAGKIDLQNSSNYTAVGSTTCTEPLLFQSSTTEAWANVYDSTMLQYKIGSSSIPIATYEANLGSVSGACTTSGVTGWPEGEGYGLVDVLTHAYLQKGFPGHFPIYNIWQDYGYSLSYSSSAGSSPATSIALFGVWQGTGGNFYRARPRVYAVGAYNAAAGLGTGYPATPTSPPTFNYSAANNIPAESNVPLIHAFAYCSGNGSACTGTSRSVVIVNADPTNAYYITLSGTHIPTGPVSEVLYSSANITDTNESTLNVTNVTNSVSSPYLVPAHSMIVLPFSTTASTPYTAF